MMIYRRLIWIGVLLTLSLLPWIFTPFSQERKIESLSEHFALSDAEGFALLRANSARDTYRGVGVSVAIVDTGIDIRHPAFGATTDESVLFNDKIIGGINLTGVGSISDQRPNTTTTSELHGTSVASIVAGSEVEDAGDYTGGVATDAKIYSLKAIGSNGTTLEKIALSWLWALEHQWDDPENPIVVINNSVKLTNLSATLCDAGIESLIPGINDLINQLNQAGISIVGAAGNDGSCEGMPFPACHSKILSASAVYDADFSASTSYQLATSCAVAPIKDTLTCGINSNDSREYCLITDQRQKGMIEINANAPTFLDVFAPGYQAYTADFLSEDGISSTDYTSAFGRTSAAAAYTSGAIALIQSAAKKELRRLLSVDEVRQILLETGTLQADYRTGNSFPLINLEAAVARIVDMKPKSMIPWILPILFDD